jgi:hypothetical protein
MGEALAEPINLAAARIPIAEFISFQAIVPVYK